MDETTNWVLVFGFLLTLALVIFILVAMGKVFAKAGRNPWLVLVPVYNAIVLLQIAGFSGWFILLALIPYIGGLALTIMQCVGLGKKFNKGTGFVIGLILLPVVFFPILGFGDAQYGADMLPTEETSDQQPPPQP